MGRDQFQARLEILLLFRGPAQTRRPAGQSVRRRRVNQARATIMNTPENAEHDTTPEVILLNELQLLLSEKRTSLSSLRTGIAIFAFALSVLSVLIATSRSYELRDVMPLLVPLVVLNLALTA